MILKHGDQRFWNENSKAVQEHFKNIYSDVKNIITIDFFLKKLNLIKTKDHNNLFNSTKDFM